MQPVSFNTIDSLTSSFDACSLSEPIFSQIENHSKIAPTLYFLTPQEKETFIRFPLQCIQSHLHNLAGEELLLLLSLYHLYSEMGPHEPAGQRLITTLFSLAHSFSEINGSYSQYRSLFGEPDWFLLLGQSFRKEHLHTSFLRIPEILSHLKKQNFSRDGQTPQDLIQKPRHPYYLKDMRHTSFHVWFALLGLLSYFLPHKMYQSIPSLFLKWHEENKPVGKKCLHAIVTASLLYTILKGIHSSVWHRLIKDEQMTFDSWATTAACKEFMQQISLNLTDDTLPGIKSAIDDFPPLFLPEVWYAQGIQKAYREKSLEIFIDSRRFSSIFWWYEIVLAYDFLKINKPDLLTPLLSYSWTYQQGIESNWPALIAKKYGREDTFHALKKCILAYTEQLLTDFEASSLDKKTSILSNEVYSCYKELALLKDDFELIKPERLVTFCFPKNFGVTNTFSEKFLFETVQFLPTLVKKTSKQCLYDLFIERFIDEINLLAKNKIITKEKIENKNTLIQIIISLYTSLIDPDKQTLAFKRIASLTDIAQISNSENEITVTTSDDCSTLSFSNTSQSFQIASPGL